MQRRIFPATIGAGILMLAIGFISLITNGTGYKEYMDATERSMQSENINVNMEFDLKLDGMTKMSGTSVQNVNKPNGKIEKFYQISRYRVKDKEIVTENGYDGKNYRMKINGKYVETSPEEQIADVAQIGYGSAWRTAVSYFAGNVKNQVDYEKNTVNIHLEGSQISSLNKVTFGMLAYMSAIPATQEEYEVYGYPEMKNIEVHTIDYRSNIHEGKLEDVNFKIIMTADDKFMMKRNIEANFSGKFNYDRVNIPSL